MQNERQTKIFKLCEKLKTLTKKFDQQTKGTHLRKMFAQMQQYTLRMINSERKKSVQHKAKGPTKSFSYELMTLNSLDQEIQKFLPHLFSQRFLKKREKKEAAQVYFTLR